MKKIYLALYTVIAVAFFQSCQKNNSEDTASAQSIEFEEKILRIAPNKEDLNAWSSFVLEQKGIKDKKFTISGINIIETDIPGKRGEVLLKVDEREINFIIGNFMLAGPNNPNRVILKPYQIIGNTESTTSVIFSSGSYGTLRMEKSDDKYIVSTTDKNLSILPIPTDY